MKRILIGCALIVFLGMAVRLVYLQQFYNIAMQEANIESRLGTECKFTRKTPHCYVLLDQLQNIVKEWAAFNIRWHRENK